MRYIPDVLGPGFESTRLQREPDEFSERSATVVRYLPSEDPKATLPDRVVPGNLRTGGAPKTGSFTVLPPQASPQQAAELDCYYTRLGSARRATAPQPVVKPLDETQQSDVTALRDYLGAELRGQDLSVADSWSDSAPQNPKFIVVYLHGWNDYFYQTHLARSLTQLGAAFYALDLHRYGRNLPDWKGGKVWNGYTENFEEYDPEIDWAVATAREEHPGLPVLVMGHSNGGGIVAGWAARHHDSFDGLIFNSPWLVQDISMIPAGKAVRWFITNRAQHLRIPMPQGNLTTYADSLAGYRAIRSPLPRRLIPFQNDPSVVGWVENPQWRILTGLPTLLGWVSTVLRNHRWLRESATFPAKPVLCLTGNHELDPFYLPEVERVDSLLAEQWKREGRTPLHRHLEQNGLRIERSLHKFTHADQPDEPEAGYHPALLGWTEAARHTDTILNGELIEQRAKELFGDNLTVRQMSGYHDLTLSQPLERAAFFAEISDWLAHSEIIPK